MNDVRGWVSATCFGFADAIATAQLHWWPATGLAVFGGTLCAACAVLTWKGRRP